MSHITSEIVELNTVKDAYNLWLELCPEALFLHHSEYLFLLENHLQCKAFVTICKNEQEQWIGALPILLKETPIGSAINSLAYFGSNGGFLLQDNLNESIKTELLNRLETWSSEIDALSWNIVSNYFLPQELDFIKQNIVLDNVSERIGQVTELPNYSEHFEEDLMGIFEDPRPRNIRKALKSGIVVELSDGQNEDWEFLHQIHSQNMQAIGAPVKHLSFFTSIPQYISKAYYSLYIAQLDSKKIGAMLVFQYNKTIEYYTPGTDVEFRNLQPSSILIFQAMKDLAAKGYKYWNWGGTASREAGVYDFKKKWGAQERLYWHLTKIKNNKLLEYSSQQLIENFYGFFVIPFNQLKN
ncbi:MAG: GNAT family N-acetyltransferase [Bacteroidetes bacterium]|nr:GNAT family N-acetyltransferase [Bacteroidota bacterium]